MILNTLLYVTRYGSTVVLMAIIDRSVNLSVRHKLVLSKRRWLDNTIFTNFLQYHVYSKT